VAFLARRLKASSIQQYLNILRLVHLEGGFPNPLANNWPLQSVLLGIKKSKADPVSRKLPITPSILLSIRSILDLTKPLHLAFWAACLVAFFALLRKASLLPPSVPSFSPHKHLTRGDFLLYPWGLALQVRHTKTIQCGQRCLIVPLPYLPCHPLCPVTTLFRLFSLTPQLPPSSPAFALPSSSGTSCLTASSFTQLLRSQLLQLGIPASSYSGHSFRRGGASWAFQMGLSAEAIRLLGDWRSDAFIAYIAPSVSSRLSITNSFSQHLPPTP